jgi:hypothetical protein
MKNNKNTFMMNDINQRLKEKLRLLDEIDQMICESESQTVSKYPDDNNSLNFQLNNNFMNNKTIDRYYNADMSQELDYPLQQKQNSYSEAKLDNSKPIFNNIYSNFKIHPQTIQNVNNRKNEIHNKLNNNFTMGNKNNFSNNNYNSQCENIFSTKECTEPINVKSKLNSRVIAEKENMTPTRATNKKSLKNFNPKISNSTSNLLKKVSPIIKKDLNVKSPSMKENQVRKSKSPTPKQLVNININISNENKNDVGNRLYNYAFFIKDKHYKRRIEGQNMLSRNMTPEITTRAKSIQRDPKKFYERLYPYHKLKNPQNSNNNLNSDDYLPTPAINVNVNMNDASNINNVHNTPFFDEKITLFNDEEEMLRRVYRRSISPVENFRYKPQINKNSIKIASKLMPSKERLLIKKKRSKSKNNPVKDFSYNSHFTYLTQENSRSFTKSPSKSPTCRTIDLYTQGIENMKKREVIHRQKKSKDAEEFKNYAYKPTINIRSNILSGRKVLKNNENNSKQKADVYDKNINWKNSVNFKNEKLRQNKSNDMKKIYTFKPNITKEFIPNDEKFITQRLDQIESYVNKRRDNLQKKKQEEEFVRKRFTHGENYKGKMTIPKEFNLKTDERGRTKSREKERQVEYRSNSPANIAVLRGKLKTKDFFDNDDYLQRLRVENLDFSYKNDQNLYDESNMHVFMNAINNLHDQLVNFKI